MFWFLLCTRFISQRTDVIAKPGKPSLASEYGLVILIQPTFFFFCEAILNSDNCARDRSYRHQIFSTHQLAVSSVSHISQKCSLALVSIGTLATCRVCISVNVAKLNSLIELPKKKTIIIFILCSLVIAPYSVLKLLFGTLGDLYMCRQLYLLKVGKATAL